MKRFFTLALIPGLAIGSTLFADNGVFPPPAPVPFFADDCCPVAMPVQCEIPVVPCPPPQTVRRVVPRTTYQTVTKTIMVPTTVMETRQTQKVEYRNEVRERSVTVYDQVPEVRDVTTQQTVLVPETRQRIETYTVQVPIERSVPETYTVNQVHTETRTKKRLVCRCVPETAMRTTDTGGEVVRRSVNSDKGGVRVHTEVIGGSKTQEPVTVMRKQLVEQTIAYDVQVTRPVMRTRMVSHTDYRTETRTRNVPEVVQVPKVEMRAHQVTEMRSVPRQTTESYTVQVPHVVTNQIRVPVTKMVPQTVTEHVPVTTYDVIEEPVSNYIPFAR